MTSTPLISVILPVFNSESYVREAVESVLSQTYKPVQLICINDGSSDNSLAILKSFGDKIILIDSAENCGIAQSRNKGVEVASGEFVAFMDADDIWKEQKLSVQMEQFVKDPELGASFSHMKCFLSPELSEEVKRTRYCPPGVLPGYISAAVLIKMSVFKKVGGFNPKWRVGEFVDWSARAKSIGVSFAIVPDVFLLRRIHGSNTGVTERPSQTDYLKIVREALERKRNQK